ncbi:MAG: type VI secretion system tube protein Hcp, partial [Verrucomicrobiae bacterium]|nr:type VI secretion system tube protein Hcp [Verrucomicrobiae bacterium]
MCWGCAVWIALAEFLAVGAAFDGYLEINGIPGDVQEEHHRDWIRIDGFVDTVGTDATGEFPIFDSLCMAKSTDRATPLLLQHCASGRHLRRARLELVTGEGERVRFYTITLSDVLIRSVQASGTTAGAEVPAGEKICLAFSGIEWTYTELDRSGLPANEVRAWWDLASRKGDIEIVPVFKVTGAK